MDKNKNIQNLTICYLVEIYLQLQEKEVDNRGMEKGYIMHPS